ncbi:NAD(P)/FAD-dependent oxidoreductase, partial [Caulobacter sp. 17J65-9]|uniref:flavin monoamine oxidase family protein n=1 Tax=Caulobacter sp. 17J65-9 TaxID=2709382 RepID=UPI0013C7B2CE
AVIGAGAAGLAAGRAAAAAGLRTLVLEARPRIGGRAWTQSIDGFPLDLGCGWLHSADRNPFELMARELGFTVDETPPPWEGQAGGQGFPPQAQAEFHAAFDRFEQRLEAAAREGPDQAARMLMDPDCPWNPLMDAVATWYSGAPFGALSLQDYVAYDDDGVNHRVVQGYGALVAAAGAGVPVQTDVEVTLVDRTGHRLRLTTSQGVLEADAVIVAVPTPALAQGRLSFNPPLPLKAEAASGLPLGLADKITFRLAEPDGFPVDSQLLGRTDTTDTCAFHLRPFGRPLIEAFVGADLARRLEAAGPQAAYDFALEELCGQLGSGFRSRARALVATAWAADPWACGSYSYARPGRRADRKALAAPVEERIFFAGEACHPTLFSTAHGAWLTGERAASQAIVTLRGA